jgi:hypothetical protein
MHEVNVFDLIMRSPEASPSWIVGSSFARLYRLTQAGAFFVIRPKTLFLSASILGLSIKRRGCAAIKQFVSQA